MPDVPRKKPKGREASKREGEQRVRLLTAAFETRAALQRAPNRVTELARLDAELDAVLPTAAKLRKGLASQYSAHLGNAMLVRPVLDGAREHRDTIDTIPETSIAFLAAHARVSVDRTRTALDEQLPAEWSKEGFTDGPQRAAEKVVAALEGVSPRTIHAHSVPSDVQTADSVAALRSALAEGRITAAQLAEMYSAPLVLRVGAAYDARGLSGYPPSVAEAMDAANAYGAAVVRAIQGDDAAWAKIAPLLTFFDSRLSMI